MTSRSSGLATWRIDLSASRREALAFHESLNHRLGAQLRDVAAARHDRAVAAKIDHLLKSGKFRWSTPAHAWFSFRIFETQNFNDRQFEEAVRLLERAASKSVAPSLSCEASRTRPPWARDAVKLMEKNMSAYFGCACRLAFTGSRLPLFQPKVFAALDLIAKAWPDAAAEIDGLVRDVVILRGKSLESSSVVGTFGALYLCPGPQWLPAFYFESLLHETAHLSFSLKAASGDFLLNPHVQVRSPFRQDLRPLARVLEAAFVLARGTHGLARLLETGECPREADTRRFFVRWREKFGQALIVLFESARWTSAGERLFRSLRNCYSELPSPLEILPAAPGTLRRR
jgi:hypothetical protein